MMYVHANRLTFMYIHTHVYTFACIYIPKHIHTRQQTNKNQRTPFSVYIYMRTYVYANTYIHAYICIYKQTQKQESADAMFAVALAGDAVAVKKHLEVPRVCVCVCVCVCVWTFIFIYNMYGLCVCVFVCAIIICIYIYIYIIHKPVYIPTHIHI